MPATAANAARSLSGLMGLRACNNFTTTPRLSLVSQLQTCNLQLILDLQQNMDLPRTVDSSGQREFYVSGPAWSADKGHRKGRSSPRVKVPMHYSQQLGQVGHY